MADPGMFERVKYTNLGGGRYRPHLELSFVNASSGQSFKAFALVDSGADHTLIPYSIGRAIGLVDATDSELKVVGGVGGQMTYIERDCEITLVNKLKKERYTFAEKVWWIHPTQKQFEDFAALISTLNAQTTLQTDTKSGSNLFQHFETEKSGTIRKMYDWNQQFETGTLLGRPFFNNFEFLQFMQKHRSEEDKCFFNYKVDASKVSKTESFEEEPVPSTNEISTALASLASGA